MSDNSSPSMPWFRGNEYMRVLAGTPPTQSEDSGYFTYQESQVNRSLLPVHLDASPDMFSADETRVNSPPLRAVTPRPIAPVLDDSLQDSQIPWWFSPQLLPTSPLPLPRQRHPFRYSDMTQSKDSDRESQINRSSSPVQNIHLEASPDMFSPTIPGSYALNLIDAIEFSPSPPRQSQIDEWLRSTPISSSMLDIVPPENDLLIFGRILNTTQPSQNETGWAEDGYNDILADHMIANDDDGEWHNDGADEVLNIHMDAFEYHEGEN